MTETDPTYTVRVTKEPDGWEVHILGPSGEVESVRHCADETDARTFASTVHQHAYWLSPEKFSEYYRLGEPG